MGVALYWQRQLHAAGEQSGPIQDEGTQWPYVPSRFIISCLTYSVYRVYILMPHFLVNTTTILIYNTRITIITKKEDLEEAYIV